MERPFIKRFIIQGLHYYHDFEMEFDSCIKILVGENGLGKTSILVILYSILEQKWLTLSKAGFDFINIEFSNSKKIEFSKSELNGYLLTKFENRDDKEKLLLKFDQIIKILTECINKEVIYIPAVRNIKIDLMRIGRTINKLELNDTKENFFSKIDQEEREIEDQLLIPTEMNKRLNAMINTINKSSLYLFQKICNDYLVNTQIKYDEIQHQFFINNKIDDDKVDINTLSSGELQILFVFCKIFSLKKDKAYILIDEPELHLSLKWQRKFLSDIISTKKCSFLLAATHSPFIFDNDLDQYAEGINVSFNK